MPLLNGVRLLMYRLRSTPGPAVLHDKTSLRLLRALAAFVAVGALFCFLAEGSGSRLPVEPASTALPGQVYGSLSDGPPVEFLTDSPDARIPVRDDAVPYDESEAAPLADVARQADVALRQALARKGLGADELAVVSVEERRDQEGRVYPFLRTAIRLDSPDGGSRIRTKEFAAALADALRVWAPKARLHQEEDNLYFIAVGNLVTHSIRCGDVPVRIAPVAREHPCLTIVIDDLGEDLREVRSLIRLPYPVTLSIWPRSAYGAYAATLAREGGRQVFLHQPMEPMASGRASIRPETLKVGMSAERIAQGLRDSLGQIPYVEGVNNHMGSRFTSDRPSAALFCEQLRVLRPDVLVLDSLTHEASVLYDEARRQGFTTFKRTLFLDDEREDHDKAAVMKRLDQGLELARKHGQAIVIGHPHQATLAALAAWTGYRAGDVDIVPFAPRPVNINSGNPAPHTETP